MPDALMVIVGGRAGGAGVVTGGGVGAVGPGDAVLPLEQPPSEISETIRKMKSGIVLDAGGAAGLCGAYH
jgi:hypothetical protein